MGDEQTGNALDPEIVEAALNALEQGGYPDPDELLARFPGQIEPIQRALDAVDSYRRQVEDHRRSIRTPMDVEHLAAGTVLGEFEIAGPLGRGNMGVVYRARQRSLRDREVALKILPPALVARDPRFAERFQREAELASGVHHPNVAEVYGFGSQDDQTFFAMQLVEGRTLEDVLGGLVMRHQLGDARHMQRDYMRLAAGLAHGVAEALDAIHTEGLVHRDVKPSNIILAGAPEHDEGALGQRPVLIDFGLIRTVGDSDLTGSRTLLGTPAFAAPEAQLGREVDARADVFSLGVILHDLLTLTRARGRSLASAGLGDLPTLNPAVHPDLAAIVRKALEEQTALRYADGASLAADLDRFLRNEPVRARPSTPIGKFRLWARRDPARATRISAFALVAALLIASLGWLTSSALELYSAGSRLVESEQRGYLLAAQEAADTMLANRAAVGWLPGLGDELDSAERHYAPGRGVLDPLCTALAGSGSSGQKRSKVLRDAHVQLQRLLLTEGNEELDEPLLRFLTRELESPEAGWRRSLAAESVAYFLCIRPWSPGDATEDSVEGGLEDALLQVLESVPEDESDRHARHFAASALTGILTPRAFRALVRQIGSDDEELTRICVSGTQRAWWELRDRDMVLDLDQDLWVDWILALERLRAGLEPGSSFSLLIDDYYAVAWTRGALQKADRLEPWPGLSQGLDDRLAEFQALMESPALEEPHVPGGDLRGFCPAHFSANTRFRRDEAWERWRLDSTEKTSFDYQNIWDTTRDREPVHLGPEPESDAPRAFFDVVSETETRIGNGILSVTWENALLEAPSASTAYLVFERPGASRLHITSRIPTGAERARITLIHEYSARWFMPYKGSATIRMVAGPKQQIVECDATFGTEELTFAVNCDESLGEDPLEILIELVSGTSTYRLHEVRVTFVPPFP